MHLRKDEDVAGVVQGGGEQLGREGGHVDGDADGQPVAVLKARLALCRHLLADDVDVRVASLLPQHRMWRQMVHDNTAQ